MPASPGGGLSFSKGSFSKRRGAAPSSLMAEGEARGRMDALEEGAV